MNNQSISSVGSVRDLHNELRGPSSIRPADAGSVERQQEFARLLGRAVDAPASDGSEPAAAPDAAGNRQDRRRAAQDLVSIALVQPILKQLRQSNNAAAPFAPGPMEKQFGTFLDAQYANSLVKSGNFCLVSAVQRWMSERDRAPLTEQQLAPLDRHAASKAHKDVNTASQGAAQ